MLTDPVARAVRVYRAGLDAAFPDRVMQVRVFGSQARGEASETSDVDVLVVLAGLTADERRRATDLGTTAAVAEGLLASPLVVSATEWEDMVRRELLLPEEIRRDGIDVP